MKLRVRRVDLIQAIHFFNEKLAEEFGEKAFSLAMQERIKDKLAFLQYRKQQMEPTNVWKVPLCVHFNDDGKFYIDIENERNILIMD